MSAWLLAAPVREQLESLRRSDVHRTENLEARAMGLGAGGVTAIMTTAGDVANIRVEGVLTKKPDLIARLFLGGNTTYADISEALELAQEDPGIKSAVLHVDSPGGSVDGLFDALASIEGFKAVKKLSVRASNAESAAYAIAALAGPIEAANPAAAFGSIGVAVSVYTSKAVVDLTNTESPKKRPNVATEEGRGTVVEYLNAIFELFTEAIANGRGTTTKAVAEQYGRGATLLAGEAKARGMIDTVVSRRQGTKTTSHVRNQAMGTMNAQTVRTQHPDVYEEILQAGVTQERERCNTHITLGEMAHDIPLALEGIKGGEGISPEMHARYMASGLNRNDRQVRQAESDVAGGIVVGASHVDAGEVSFGDQVVAAMKANNGYVGSTKSTTAPTDANGTDGGGEESFGDRVVEAMQRNNGYVGRREKNQ